MKKFRKKFRKFYAAHAKIFWLGLILFLEIVITGLLWFAAGKLIFQEVRLAADEKIFEEQQQRKNKTADIVSEINEQVSFLEEKWNRIEKKKYLSSSDKKEIFERLEDLEKQAVGLQNELSKYDDDHSVQFYDHRDQKIEQYFAFLWSLPLKTQRAAHTFEQLIFTNYISADQVELTRKSLSAVRWHLDQAMNMK